MQFSKEFFVKFSKFEKVNYSLENFWQMNIRKLCRYVSN